MRMIRTATVALVATTLAGCGVFGGSWDVTMEVDGAGTATVTASFAGENGDPARQTLPFSVSQNVGFGFNVLRAEGAPAGAVCRILVDDKVVQENPVDDGGVCGASANNQDD